MSDEFTKLSEVPVTDNPTDNANVLIEENNEIKKTPKSKIGGQADWNETDETKSSYILNKPERLGGCSLYYRPYPDSHLIKGKYGSIPEDLSFDNSVTREEFLTDYVNNGCVIVVYDTYNQEVTDYRTAVYFKPYNQNGATIYVGGQSWSDNYIFKTTY